MNENKEVLVDNVVETDDDFPTQPCLTERELFEFRMLHAEQQLRLRDATIHELKAANAQLQIKLHEANAKISGYMLQKAVEKENADRDACREDAKAKAPAYEELLERIAKRLNLDHKHLGIDTETGIVTDQR